MLDEPSQPTFKSNIFFLYRPIILSFSKWRRTRVQLWWSDSDDEKPQKTRKWIKRRSESGYFQNIFQELNVEDRMGFKDMFRFSVTDYEFLFCQISDLISSSEIISGNRPILADQRLALTLRYLVTGESFQSLSYQFFKKWCWKLNDAW